MTDLSFGKRTAPAVERKSEAVEDDPLFNPALSPEERMAEESLKRTRIPMSSARQKLTTPDIPGYHLHWINDEPGRINAALQGGYEFVKPEEALVNSSNTAAEVVGAGTDLGTRVSVVVGSNRDGSTLRGYLMKIRSEWYEEDQASLQGRVDKIHEAMNQGNQKLQPGESERDKALRYVQRSSRTSTYSKRATST